MLYHYIFLLKIPKKITLKIMKITNLFLKDKDFLKDDLGKLIIELYKFVIEAEILDKDTSINKCNEMIKQFYSSKI